MQANGPIDACMHACCVKWEARKIFLLLKSHIAPDAYTFNIFHGWCKISHIDEVQWTIQKMRGHGCHPSVVSYSTIIQFYCCRCNFRKFMNPLLKRLYKVVLQILLLTPLSCAHYQRQKSLRKLCKLLWEWKLSDEKTLWESVHTSEEAANASSNNGYSLLWALPANHGRPTCLYVVSVHAATHVPSINLQQQPTSQSQPLFPWTMRTNS